MFFLALISLVKSDYYVKYRLDGTKLADDANPKYTVKYKTSIDDTEVNVEPAQPLIDVSSATEFTISFFVSATKDGTPVGDCKSFYYNPLEIVLKSKESADPTAEDEEQLGEDFLQTFCPSLATSFLIKFSLSGISTDYTFSYRKIVDGVEGNLEQITRKDDENYEVTDKKPFICHFYAKGANCDRIVYKAEGIPYFPIYMPLSQGLLDSMCACKLENCYTCDGEDFSICSECVDDSEPVDGLCSTTPADKCEVANCETCETNDNTKCKTCKDGFTTNDKGECVSLPADKCEVTNCETCETNDNTKCQTCKDGFTKNDKGECVSQQEASCEEVSEKDALTGDCLKCDSNKKLCETCYDSEYYIPDTKGSCQHKCFPGQNYCQECNEQATECKTCSLEILKVLGYSCYCDNDFELVDGKCVEPIKGLEPAKDDIGNSEKITSSTSNNVQKIDTKGLENPDASKIYEINMDGTATRVEIVNEKGANLLLKDISGEQTAIVPQDDNTKVILSCDDSTTIQLKNSANTVIRPKGSLTINAIAEEADKVTDITIGKIVLTTDLELQSDKNLVIKELQVFDSARLKAPKKNIKIESVKIEQGGYFSQSKNLILQDIEVGANSNILLNDALGNTNITFYQGRSQADDPLHLNPPLESDGVPESFPKSFTIKKKELNQLLNSDEFVIFSVLGYPDEQKNTVLEACDKLAAVYQNTDAPYKYAYCRTSKFEGRNAMQLYATNSERSSKKKGLSGGAIAGIVIGCVAAVAIAAVLIWYFVFYRKSKVGASEDAEP